MQVNLGAVLNESDSPQERHESFKEIQLKIIHLLLLPPLNKNTIYEAISIEDFII